MMRKRRKTLISILRLAFLLLAISGILTVYITPQAIAAETYVYPEGNIQAETHVYPEGNIPTETYVYSGGNIPTERHVYYPENIQTAINAAATGDIIIVHQGTYKKNINFSGKAITIRSTDPNDPDVVAATIIDSNRVASAVTFRSGGKNGAALSGFTVRNGKAGSGGGIFCYYSSPNITNCIISGNLASGTYSGGGGIYCYSSSPNITNCTISANSAPGTYSGGGGIYCYSSSPSITNCDISGNSASGIYSGGGGIYCYSSSPAISNCITTENSACNGGGIYCYGSSPGIINCTISGNSVTCNGGGIFCGNSSSPIITNCILWNDSSTSKPPYEIYVSFSTPKISCSDIQGGYSGVSNINADPMFINSGAGDFHLQSGSPCINTGASGSGIPLYDKDGNLRIHQPDIGAYEFESEFDNIPPSITCPGNITIEAEGPNGVPATNAAIQTFLSKATATDNVGLVSITNNAPPSFGLSITDVTFTATDKAGNTASCTAKVTVVDTTPPVITCPAGITVEAEGPKGVPANNAAIQAFLSGATATDNVDGWVSVINNAPAVFGLGSTDVTFTATDKAGNTARCTAKVTVVDRTPPVITCPAGITVEAEGPKGVPATNAAIQAFLSEATATDNVDGWVSVINNAPAVFGLGSTDVSFTATDKAGNRASCMAKVTVVDRTPPVITCPAGITVEAEGPYGVPVSNAAIQAFLKGASATDKVDGSVIVTPECSGCTLESVGSDSRFTKK